MGSGYRTIEEIESGLPYPVVALGFFDGVHLGHQAVLDVVKQKAKAHKGTSIVLTLDQHPAAVVANQEPPKLITTLSERIQLLLEAGMDRVVTVRFDREFAAQPPMRFVSDILVGRLRAKEVVAGYDYRFGHRGAGDVQYLSRLGWANGFTVTTVAPVQVDGQVVSSTLIRSLLQGGQVEEVTKLLTRPYRLSGVVVKGDQRGRNLGFPTANLAVDKDKVMPADGVYAVKVSLAKEHITDPGEGNPGSGRSDLCCLSTGVISPHGVLPIDAASYPGVLSISDKPTFDGRERTIEVHILDFDGDLYRRQVQVDFIRYLRPIFRFNKVEDLVAQIQADIQVTRDLFEVLH